MRHLEALRMLPFKVVMRLPLVVEVSANWSQSADISSYFPPVLEQLESSVNEPHATEKQSKSR
jgi:hypothetical protein